VTGSARWVDFEVPTAHVESISQIKRGRQEKWEAVRDRRENDKEDL